MGARLRTESGGGASPEGRGFRRGLEPPSPNTGDMGKVGVRSARPAPVSNAGGCTWPVAAHPKFGALAGSTERFYPASFLCGPQTEGDSV